MDVSRVGVDRVFFGRLDSGADVIRELTGFVSREGVKSGLIGVIGALSKIRLGYYNLDKKDYELVEEEGLFELMGIGNISYREGSPYIHLHVSVGEEDKTYTGHMLEGNIVGPTLEFIIIEFDRWVERERDVDTGLYLLRFALMK